jgi:cyclohexanone monooxygenase
VGGRPGAGLAATAHGHFNTLVSGGFQEEDLVGDGWTDIIGKLLIMVRREDADLSAEGVTATMELADFEKMEQIRARVDNIVQDPAIAESLKPFYRQFCKRPCFHDEYLDTYNRANVTLVDTDGRRGAHHAERSRGQRAGVRARLHHLRDRLEVGTDYTRRAGYEVVGRDGLTLTEKWADGAPTLHGMHSRGFPNCLIFSPAQSGFTVNFPHMLDEQARHAAYIVRYGLDEDVRGIEPSEAAEAAWVETISAGPEQPEVLRGVHAGLLQQRGPAGSGASATGSMGPGRSPSPTSSRRGAPPAILAGWRSPAERGGPARTSRAGGSGVRRPAVEVTFSAPGAGNRHLGADPRPGERRLGCRAERVGAEEAPLQLSRAR